MQFCCASNPAMNIINYENILTVDDELVGKLFGGPLSFTVFV
jgi:hypothetical protein